MTTFATGVGGIAIAATLATASAATLEHEPYGTTQDGRAVDVYTMTNAHGVLVRFLSYGGVITEIHTPDRKGRHDNIVLGLRNLHDYETISAHYGAITGRYANRIAGAQFTLNGQTYHLIANNGANSIHGGPNALDKQVWNVAQTQAASGVAATLSYISKDGDQGFPGTLTTHVTYTLTDDDALRIDYLVSTDKDTVINFTNHSYFNLAGNGSGSVENQMLLVNADTYTPFRGPDEIPTGEVASVEGTPLDFRQMMPIGARLRSPFQQMIYGHGYDHNFVVNKRAGELGFAARGYDPRTGRVIDCFTTEPGVQVYTSGGLNGSVVGSSGTTYRQGEGFTLETQHFADSPNQPNFPSTVLKPGQDYRSTTIFRFATDNPLPAVPR